MAGGLIGRKRVTSNAHDQQITQISEVLAQLEVLIAGAEHDADELSALQASRAVLQELFLIVVAGEFNAGKSSLLNALLGAQILPEGVTPTTDAITCLQYGETAQNSMTDDGVRHYRYPADVLRQLTIVDTPGTNAIIRRHEQLTRTFVPRADLVLFVTSADRPFTESERTFLQLIRSWGKQVVVVLNKVDILLPEEEQQVERFVRDNALQVLGTAPQYFAVSARLALLAASAADAAIAAAQRADSRIELIEQYIVTTLDDTARLKLKLQAPLGVAQRVVSNALTRVESQLTTLAADLAALDNLERQLAGYAAEIASDAAFYLHAVDQLLLAVADRGDRYFRATLRFGRLRDLMRHDGLSADFEREVLGDVAREVDEQVQQLIDRLIEKRVRLQQQSDEYIRQRAAAYSEQLVGRVGGGVEINRQALLAVLGESAQRVLAGYDRADEAARLAAQVREALTVGALSGLSALGLGAVFVAIFQTLLLDVTGIIAAVGLAALGWAYLPYKRRAAQDRLRQRINELRAQIAEQLNAQAAREGQRSVQQIRERNEPFLRFVRSEHQRLRERHSALTAALGQVTRLTTTL